MHIDILKCLIIFSGAIIYNIFSGMSSILLARNFVKLGAISNGIYQIISVFIFSLILKDVKTQFYLLIPLFIGYVVGIIISGKIIEKLQLGEVHIHAYIKTEESYDISKKLKDQFGIYSTAMKGQGAYSPTTDLVVATKRKELMNTINAIKQISEEYETVPKISFVDANIFWKNDK